jgi:glucosyl-3-phosphoglycerate synthase
MEYVQEAVATLHDFGDARPPAPTDRAAVVVPMTGRDHASLAAERVLSKLATVDPARVVVALRADADTVGDVVAWVDGFDVDAEVLWCTAPAVETALAEAGIDGPPGKGRDVWLGLGRALDEEFVVVHDADATSYDISHVPRLLFPLAEGYEFSKGYYARVEDGQLYGRLCRLFFEPLVRALRRDRDAPILGYLDAFRYGLAGEFAATTDLARHLRAQRGWGLEVGTLGEAFRLAGVDNSAQVDLGVHQHDHRSVGGPEGLGDMCSQVGAALFRALADAGVEPNYETLPARYRDVASELIESYAVDAAFNGLTYDAASEREQVATYADAIAPPGPDTRLPAWADAPIEPPTIAARSAEAIDETTER